MVSIEFLRVAAMIVLFGLIWRLLTLRAAGTTIGDAMAFVY
jgi:hypothetical protein